MRAGQTLAGRYLLVAKLGAGGMGEVWRAHDTREPGVVAVKGVLGEPGSVAANHRRLEREAAILARLSHPHIVPIEDKFIEANRFYLVTRYVPGENLREAMEAGSLTTARKVAILIDVLDALAYLHAKTSVVHRDLKPANILLDRRGRAYVADFGIARSIVDPQMTGSYFIGTPDYSAPEVRDGAVATAASDVWSFGAVALRLFTGRRFYEGLPEGNFAGNYTDLIRAALRIQASQRPSASNLLESFQRARLRAAPKTITATRPYRWTASRASVAPAPAAAGGGRARVGSRAPAPKPAASERWPWWLMLITLAAVAAVVGAVAFLANGPHGPSSAPPAHSASLPAAIPATAMEAPHTPPKPEASTPPPTAETPINGTIRFAVVSCLAVPQAIDASPAAGWHDTRMLSTGLPTTHA